MDDNARTGELRRKLEKDPGSRLFAQLAEELRKEGKHDEAISVARKGLEKNPNYPSARLTLARALLDSGRPAEARPELESIVKGSPDNIMASRLLGDALAELGELAPALQQFEKTLRISPGDKAVIERMAELKARMGSAPSPVPPASVEVAAPAVETPSAAPAAEAPLPSVFAAEPLPSVFPEVPLPSVFPEVPVPSVLPEVAVPSVFPEVAVPPSVSVAESPAPAPPAVGVALDRDLASGTFSPGSLNAADIQRHFEETAAEPPTSSAAPELPSVETPAEDTDDGAKTLPLTSLTLADLYLQQGLKAEASAVLSQVLKEEPDNAQARSRFDAVSSELASTPAVTLPAAPPVEAKAPARAPRTRAEIAERAIISLKAFASACEREAVQQKATERGAI
ncbi:MAG TPA: tetratricopeptide repeat protein [Vicinamibacteria bacterium]|nr:tetratricopeptide repeat protein [Vicinamibacteria bacterium]